MLRTASFRFVGVLVLAGALAGARTASAAPFEVGDIFAAVGDSNLDGVSEVRRYNAAGVLQETLNLTGASQRSTGMAFDRAGNLYATAFDSNLVKVFDQTGALLGNFGSGYSFPEAVVIDNSGNFYISSVGGVGIKKFDAAGTLLATYLAGTRVDWMDLAADQKTMLYTQEGSRISRVDVSTAPGTALTNFVLTGGTSFALRILPDGSVLVANGANVKLYDSSATLVRTYSVAGESVWFAVNLDPDGTSFWSGSIQTGNLYKFDITCGGVSACTTFMQSIATGVPNQQPTRALAGVAIFGERTVGCPTCVTTTTTSTTLSTSITTTSTTASTTTTTRLTTTTTSTTTSTTSTTHATTTTTSTTSSTTSSTTTSTTTTQAPTTTTSTTSTTTTQPPTTTTTIPGNLPPDCSAAAAQPATLWPPNHQFVDVSVVGVTDPDGDPVAITITGVTQDEPLNGGGSGNTCPDATGVGTATASLRAEREGTGDGRVYHISFTADDGRSGRCTGTVTVCVPHDQGQGRVCVDQGPLVDSTGPTCVGACTSGCAIEMAVAQPLCTGENVPAKLVQRLDTAQQLIAQAAGTSGKKTAKKLMRRGIKVAKQAVGIAAKDAKKGTISAGCAASVATEFGNAKRGADQWLRTR